MNKKEKAVMWIGFFLLSGSIFYSWMITVFIVLFYVLLGFLIFKNSQKNLSEIVDMEPYKKYYDLESNSKDETPKIKEQEEMVDKDRLRLKMAIEKNRHLERKK